MAEDPDWFVDDEVEWGFNSEEESDDADVVVQEFGPLEDAAYTSHCGDTPPLYTLTNRISVAIVGEVAHRPCIMLGTFENASAAHVFTGYRCILNVVKEIAHQEGLDSIVVQCMHDLTRLGYERQAGEMNEYIVPRTPHVVPHGCLFQTTIPEIGRLVYGAYLYKPALSMGVPNVVSVSHNPNDYWIIFHIQNAHLACKAFSAVNAIGLGTLQVSTSNGVLILQVYNGIRCPQGFKCASSVSGPAPRNHEGNDQCERAESWY